MLYAPTARICQVCVKYVHNYYSDYVCTREVPQ